MKINYFEKEFIESKTIFIFMGKAGAGIRDLSRIKALFPLAQCFSRTELSWWKLVIGCNYGFNIVYIHSSPWNIIHKNLTIFNSHFLIIHNPVNFVSRTGFKGKLDKLIFNINLFTFNNLIFLSKHVMHGYYKKHIKMLLTDRPYIEYKIKNKTEINKTIPSIFFFGRYLPYKNLEIFIELARESPHYNFYVYSYGCPIFKNQNLIVFNGWIEEKTVDEIFITHDILITPYTETSQSGPFFLGLENGKIIIAPKINGFKDYSDYEKLVFYSPNNIEKLKIALKEAVTIYEQNNTKRTL
jgi:glycosyltransferase involved in cell wall biosynthesis